VQQTPRRVATIPLSIQLNYSVSSTTSAKTPTKTKMGIRDRDSSRFSVTNIINLILRFLQMIFALAVVGLYAQDLNKARKEHKYSDGKWVCLLNRHIATLVAHA
jgi:cation transporter-like permease